MRLAGLFGVSAVLVLEVGYWVRWEEFFGYTEIAIASQSVPTVILWWIVASRYLTPWGYEARQAVPLGRAQC